MSRFLLFLWRVLNNWAGYVTGGLLVGTLTIYAIWRDAQAPRAIMLGSSAVALLLAFFKAWDDQYRENQVGREKGSLVLTALNSDYFVDPATNKDNVQLILVLKNLQPRLLEYNVDTFDLKVESMDSDSSYRNRGGFVYAGQSQDFRSPPVRGVDFQKVPLSGTLKYSISYGVVGGRSRHHTGKTLDFDLFTTGVKYLLLEERED